MDVRALLFSIAVTGVAALLFGVVPALQSVRTDLRASLHDAARSSVSRGRRTLLTGLVVGEISLAMLLLATAALLGQALRNALQVDPGFRPRNVLTYRVALPEAKYKGNPERVIFVNDLVARMRALPGVESAGAVSVPPLGGHWGIFFEVEGAHRWVQASGSGGPPDHVPPDTWMHLAPRSWQGVHERDGEGANASQSSIISPGSSS
jgi:hypothetical protein